MDDEALSNRELLEEYIYPNMELNYYWSDDFSPEFYQKLARAGFITTSMPNMEDELVLLPEIQFEYAVLDFNDLHISKKVKKLLNTSQYKLSYDKRFKEVIEKIEAYHNPSWLVQEYKSLMLSMHQQSLQSFQLVSVELTDTQNQRLVAGEIGYIIGRTYTSLTGFTSKEKQYNNWGKLQLVLLAQDLQKKAICFWNLGHASLQYKIDLGAHILKRDQFLKRWKQAINP